MSWNPRAIIKLRDINRHAFEKLNLELVILRSEVDQDWDGIDRDIWVKLMAQFA